MFCMLSFAIGIICAGKADVIALDYEKRSTRILIRVGGLLVALALVTLLYFISNYVEE